MVIKNKVTQSATNITDKKKWVINMSSRQLIHIETNLLAKGLSFSITSKTLPNKDIIATIEYAYQLLKKDPTSKIKTKTLKQLKVLKDNKFIDNKLLSKTY